MTNTWMNTLNESTREAIVNALNYDPEADHAYGCVEFNDDCYVEVRIDERESLELTIYHSSDDNERPLPNVRQYIMDNIVSWEEVYNDWADDDMDEWQANGFRDEADYWRYRLGS